MKTFFDHYTRPRFEKSLFLEGLRQLRLLGILFAVIELLFCGGLALDMGREGWWQKSYAPLSDIEWTMDEVVAYTAVGATVFLVAALIYISQFLRSGKARDFYCSTPHSVGTLWLNFALSAFAWNAAVISGGSLLVTLIGMISDAKVFGLCMQMWAGSLCYSLMIFGIVTLAVTLTGRLLNVFLTTAGLMTLPTMVWYTSHAALFEYFRAFSFVQYTHGKTFPDPLAGVLEEIELADSMYLYALGGRPEPFELICSGAAMLYCLVMGAIYLGVAYLFASVRTGDTAGRPFVNQPAHILSLTAVMTPVVCFFTYWFVDPMYTTLYNNDRLQMVKEYLLIAIGFVFGVLVLHWICELAFTFDVRHSLRAYRYLPIPAAIAIAATGFGYLCDSAEFQTTVDPEQVASFSLIRNANLNDDLAIFRLSDTYGRQITEKSSFTDADMIAYLSRQINDFVAMYRENPAKAYRWAEFSREEYLGTVWDEEDILPEDGQVSPFINLKLTLKDGREICRAIAFDEEHMNRLTKVIEGDKAFMKEFLAMPPAERLNIRVELDDLTSDEAEAVYEAFVEEYNAMSDAQKLAYLKKSLYSQEEYRSGEQEEGVSIDSEESVPVESEEVPAVAVTDETQSAADGQAIRFRSVNPLQVGSYYIPGSSYTADTSLLSGEEPISLSIYGYAFGHLYRYHYHYSADFVINAKTFPKTHAMIVKTCNSHIDELVQWLTTDKKTVDFARVDATYFDSKEQCGIVHHLLTSEKDKDYAKVEIDDYLNGGSPEEDYFFDDDARDPDTGKAFNGRTVDIDADAQIAGLLADAVATGESVDFTKPYCRLTVYLSDRSKPESFRRTFFIQTDLQY